MNESLAGTVAFGRVRGVTILTVAHARTCCNEGPAEAKGRDGRGRRGLPSVSAKGAEMDGTRGFLRPHPNPSTLCGGVLWLRHVARRKTASDAANQDAT